jgi:hypothetical protein
MKKNIFTLIVAAAFVALNGFAGNDAVPFVRKMLFVGLKDGYFSSDYYTGDQIAENFAVSPEAMDEFINGAFYDAFENVAGKKNLHLTVCDERAKRITADLLYDYDGDVLYSNLSKIDEKEYRDVLQQAQAEYLLVFDQYYIKKEGYPYDNFAHIFHYSVYDASKNKVYDGHYRFTAFDLGTLPMLQKQIKKAADKCIRSIQ